MHVQRPGQKHYVKFDYSMQLIMGLFHEWRNFFSPPYAMSLPLAVSTLAPFLTCIQLLPQLYKTVKTRRVDDLSFYSLILLFSTNIMWILHGYFIMDIPLIVAGSISSLVNMALITLYLRYKK